MAVILLKGKGRINRPGNWLFPGLPGLFRKVEKDA
jgi:hypothetical protein